MHRGFVNDIFMMTDSEHVSKSTSRDPTKRNRFWFHMR